MFFCYELETVDSGHGWVSSINMISKLSHLKNQLWEIRNKRFSYDTKHLRNHTLTVDEDLQIKKKVLTFYSFLVCAFWFNFFLLLCIVLNPAKLYLDMIWSILYTFNWLATLCHAERELLVNPRSINHKMCHNIIWSLSVICQMLKDCGILRCSMFMNKSFQGIMSCLYDGNFK